MRRMALTIQVAAIALLVTGIAPRTVWAQSSQSATIVGKVTDESGGAMPGVTVTVKSPQLQVPQINAVTGVDGDYRILDLPPGTYTVQFELQGFQTSVHTDVRLTVGLAGRVDSVLKIGALSETIQVTGMSPVVDTVHTSGNTTLVQDQLRTIPMGGTMQEMLPLAAGVTMTGKPDVGDSNLASRQAIVTYGVVLQTTLDVEGINTVTDHAANTAVYFNSFSLEEVQFKTSGNNADIGFPGVAQVALLKSGSNAFHGTARSAYENLKWQNNNVTPELAAQGITNTNPITEPGFYEYIFDLGGRIVKDKLWFYGAYSNQAVDQGQVGFVAAPNADGCWFVTCGGTTPATYHTDLPGYSAKVSYQLTSNTRLIATDMYAVKHLSQNGGSTLVPLPSSRFQRQPQQVWKGEMQRARDKMLVDVLFGYGGYHVNYITQPASNTVGFPSGTDVAGNPSSRELSTGLRYGPSVNPEDRPQNRFEGKAILTYMPESAFLGGKHQLKFGTTLDWENAGTKILQDKVAGDYELQFNRGVPSQIVIYNYPFASSINDLHSQALYFTDTYTLNRLTINAGVRWERYHSYYPEQTKEAGQFSVIFPARTYPNQDVLTWIDTVPRIGAAYDLTGNGKTVLKGSWGIFGDTMGDLYANNFNPDASATQTYAWTGPCVTTPYKNNTFSNSSCDVDPGFLASLPSRTALSATGGINSVLNPDLKQNKTYEYSARVERELIPNVAISAGWISHRVENLYYNLQFNRPYELWVPATPATPFLDQNGQPVTIYTYPASLVGASFNLLQSGNASPDRADVFHSFEVAATKRYSKKWTGSTSMWWTKNHQWLTNGTLSAALPQNPNEDRFQINDQMDWEARANGTYSLPYNVDITGSYRAQSGQWGQRTQAFTGAALRQGSTTLRMGPYGEFRAPAVQLVNLRLNKGINMGRGQRLSLDFQVFNLLNSSGVTSTNYQTGSQFGQVTGIVSGRVYRLGAGFTF
jgi:Carboxypeptidase regulatory-like domain